MSEILPCPGCKGPCSVNQNDIPSKRQPATHHWVYCDAVTSCGYSGPARRTQEEAVSLHNSICRPSSGEQRPVAWLYEANALFPLYTAHRRQDLVEEGRKETSLFTHPSPSEEAIREAAKEIDSLDTLGLYSNARIESIFEIIRKHLGAK